LLDAVGMSETCPKADLGAIRVRSLYRRTNALVNHHGVDKQPPRDRRLERHCQELRYAFAVFKSAVSKPSLKRSYTD
jgi:hypothetical protein